MPSHSTYKESSFIGFMEILLANLLELGKLVKEFSISAKVWEYKNPAEINNIKLNIKNNLALLNFILYILAKILLIYKINQSNHPKRSQTMVIENFYAPLVS